MDDMKEELWLRLIRYMNNHNEGDYSKLSNQIPWDEVKMKRKEELYDRLIEYINTHIIDDVTPLGKLITWDFEKMDNDEWSAFLKTHGKSETDKAASAIKCTMCGKPFDMWGIFVSNNRFDFYIGFGSTNHCYDRFQCDLCIDCFDKVIDMIIPMCKTNPIIGEH
jgi:hypothetical protein